MKLYEMASHLNDIKHDLSIQSAPVFHHLVKYFYIEDCELRDHWTHEIYSFLNDVDLVKGKNKFPKYDFIMKNTYDVHADSILLKKPHILQSYRKNHIIKNIEDDKFMAFCKEYFERISYLLSMYGFVNEETIKLILEDASQKYS